MSITPENEDKKIEYVAFTFVYSYNENEMTVYNAELNISSTGYSTESSENSTGDDTTDTTEEDNYIDYEVVSETLDDNQPYMETNTGYYGTGNYVTSETDEAGNTVTYTYDVSRKQPTQTDVISNISMILMTDLLR